GLPFRMLFIRPYQTPLKSCLSYVFGRFLRASISANVAAGERFPCVLGGGSGSWDSAMEENTHKVAVPSTMLMKRFRILISLKFMAVGLALAAAHGNSEQWYRWLYSCRRKSAFHGVRIVTLKSQAG